MLLGVIVRQGGRRISQQGLPLPSGAPNLPEVDLSGKPLPPAQQRKGATPGKSPAPVRATRDPRRDPRLARQQEAQAPAVCLKINVISVEIFFL